MESGQCLFFYSSIRFNSGWFMNVVGIVPQWSESVFIFHSCIRLNYCWFINVNEDPSLYFQLCRGYCFPMVVIVYFLLLYTIQFLLVFIFLNFVVGIVPQ